MVWFPHAKINLGLHVLRKRADGFHDIETCFYPIAWTDILEIIPSEEFKFTSSGLPIPGDDNLCSRAYHLLKGDFDLPLVQIHLHKLIPIGAGLGGGSSDAAFTLKGLNELFQLQIPKDKLHAYAAQLGSDCAFFLYDTPMMAGGKGDDLKVVNGLDLSGYKLVVIYPELHVPTASAYQSLTPNEDRENLKSIILSKSQEWKDKLANDFEETIFVQHPVIRQVKDQLYKLGAVYASMSGSGSSVYGLFKENREEDIEQVFSNYTIFLKNI